MDATTFAAVFVALYVGNSVGDHWVQTSCQSGDKGKPGWTGRLADARHVASLGAARSASPGGTMIAQFSGMALVGSGCATGVAD